MGLEIGLAALGTWLGAGSATAVATGATAIAATATVAGAGYAAYSTYQQGKASQALDNYNANLAAQNSATAGRDAAIEANQTRLQNQRVMAKQRAAFAASGVIGETGSPLMVQTEQAGYLEMGALETERQGNIRAAQLAQQGVLDRMEGGAARRAGNTGAVSTILGGATKAFATYEGIG